MGIKVSRPSTDIVEYPTLRQPAPIRTDGQSGFESVDCRADSLWGCFAEGFVEGLGGTLSVFSLMDCAGHDYGRVVVTAEPEIHADVQNDLGRRAVDAAAPDAGGDEGRRRVPDAADTDDSDVAADGGRPPVDVADSVEDTGDVDEVPDGPEVEDVAEMPVDVVETDVSDGTEIPEILKPEIPDVPDVPALDIPEKEEMAEDIEDVPEALDLPSDGTTDTTPMDVPLADSPSPVDTSTDATATDALPLDTGPDTESDVATPVNTDIDATAMDTGVDATMVDAAPPPNTAAVLGNLSISGDSCAGYVASWSATDAENDSQTCMVSVVDAASQKGATKVMVSGPSGKFNATINGLPHFADFTWSVSCKDPQGLSASQAAPAVLTTIPPKTRLWMRFQEAAGKTVTDSSPSQLHGQIIGTADWLVDGGLKLDGATRVNLPKTEFWNAMSELSVLMVFTPASLDQVALATLLEVSNGEKDQAKLRRYAFDIFNKAYPRFIQVYGTSFSKVQSPSPMVLGANELLATYNAKGKVLYTWDGKKWAALDNNATYPGPIEGGSLVTLGCWADGSHCFKGTLHEVAIVEKNMMTLCE